VDALKTRTTRRWKEDRCFAEIPEKNIYHGVTENTGRGRRETENEAGNHPKLL
jgi:hypothetical protein